MNAQRKGGRRVGDEGSRVASVSRKGGSRAGNEVSCAGAGGGRAGNDYFVTSPWKGR